MLFIVVVAVSLYVYRAYLKNRNVDSDNRFGALYWTAWGIFCLMLGGPFGVFFGLLFLYFGTFWRKSLKES